MEKKKLLLHCFCAPCASAVIEKLENDYNLTLFFSNSNIMPKQEYDKRLSELFRYITFTKKNIPIIVGEYDNNEFLECVKGLENESEGGSRCAVCFAYRLEKTAKMAKQYGFDLFASTLTVSPHKNSEMINNIGTGLQKKYGIEYLVSDFKKNNGYLRSIQISKEFNIYRQNYCGCKLL